MDRELQLRREGLVAEVDLEDTGSSLGEREPTDRKAECSCEGDLEEEGPRGAASGALRGVVKQASLDAMSAEEQEKVQARATQVHRQVHFRDFGHWPEDPHLWLCSTRLMTARRGRISELIHTLKCNCSPVPPPKGFIDGIPHRNDKADYRGKLWPVVKAFASAKVHFLGLLQKRFEGVSFDSNPALATKNRFFCKAFPNLQPASGGGQRVEFLPRGHPMWETLADKWDVRTIPDFLKHLFNKHDGEARLIQEGVWENLDESIVRNPVFWSSQFARTDESERWLSYELSRRRHDQWLTMREVDWVLAENDSRTLLIRKTCAASGAPGDSEFQIRTGTVVTLAEMFYYGSGHRACTAYDIYKLYMDLPMFIHKHRRRNAVEQETRRVRQRF